MPGFPSAPVNTPSAAEVHADAPHPSAPARLGWARLLKRVFDIDIEQCPQCGGTLTILAAIEDASVIAKILTNPSRLARPGTAPMARAVIRPTPKGLIQAVTPSQPVQPPSRQPPLAGTRARGQNAPGAGRLGRLKGPKHPASWTDGSRP